MKKIIITIVKKSRDESGEIRCDIEVPTEVRADILTKDIVQVLEGYCKKPMKADGGTGSVQTGKSSRTRKDLCRKRSQKRRHHTDYGELIWKK